MIKVYLLCLVLTYFAIAPAYSSSTLHSELQKLEILTEHAPPISFRNSKGQVDGLASEIVNEILSRLDIDKKITILPWARAFNISKKSANIVLYPVAKIEERVEFFHWIGPIFRMEAGLYTRKRSKAKVNSLEEAKKLKSIGVNRASYDTEYLKENRFRNLSVSTSGSSNIKKLMTGRLQAISLSNIAIKALLKQEGYSMAQVKLLFPLMTVDNYIVLSKDVSPEVVQAWRDAFEQIRLEGLLGKFERKWLW